MIFTDIADHVEHHRGRVLQDALAEATAHYWRRRAQTFRDATPGAHVHTNDRCPSSACAGRGKGTRHVDFTGRATAAELEAQRQRIAAVVLACAERAQLTLDCRIDDFPCSCTSEVA